jgi:hypothetical protein
LQIDVVDWQKFGNGQTPESTGLKGDKLVEIIMLL